MIANTAPSPIGLALIPLKMSSNLTLYLKKATLVNVKTDIIGSIRTSPTERDVKLKLVIMYVQNFKADVIVFIYKIIMCLTSHYPSQFVENIRQ
jgi:hypothetical protein